MRRRRPGRPSPTATTRWSSRRPGPERRWPRSCGRSTGSRPSPGPPAAGTRVLYVSPLKALAVDVERNLRTPLTGITRIAERSGQPRPEISVGVRSGDTPPARRRELIAKPPGRPDHHTRVAVPDADVGRARNAGRGADRHRRRGARRRRDQARRPSGALAGAARPAAGASPRSGSGCRRRCGRRRRWRDSCPGRRRRRSSPRPRPRRSTCRCRCPFPIWPTSRTTRIWPDVEERIVDLIEAHRSSIVFANSRRLAERLTSRLNEIHAERNGIELPSGPNPQVGGGSPAHIMGSGLRVGCRDPAGPRPPRLGQQGAAGPGRGRPQVRTAEGRRRDLQPGTGHRHGRGRPGDPGGDAAVGGQRAAAHRQSRPSGRRDLAGRAVPEAPHRPDRLRGDGAADALRRNRDDAGADEPARRAGPAHRGRVRARAVGRRPLVRRGAAKRAVRDPAAQCVRGDAGPAVRASTRPRSSPSCGPAWCTTATRARSPRGRARSGWR